MASQGLTFEQAVAKLEKTGGTSRDPRRGKTYAIAVRAFCRPGGSYAAVATALGRTGSLGHAEQVTERAVRALAQAMSAAGRIRG